MKKIILPLFVVFPLFIFAQKISREEIAVASKTIIAERFPKEISYEILEIRALPDDTAPMSFLVRLFPYGFVVLSANQSVHPLLAYSFYSSTGEGDINPGFWAFVSAKNFEIAKTKENSLDMTKSKSEWNRLLRGEHKTTKAEILPLLTTEWNQGVYYNQYCPNDPAGPDDRCVTGCVATALGQLMNYFRWPQSGIGQYTSEDTVYGTLTVDYSAAKYNFNEMSIKLNRQNDATANLIYNIGVSVDMHYGPDGSGMTNHKAAHTMKTFFQYGDTAAYAFRDDVNWDWDSMLVSYLSRGIPLYYAGWGDTNYVSGHAFIVDGHQDSTYFHFNWGWGGSWDGYFYIDELNPSGADFTLMHEAVVNVMPSGAYPYFCSGVDTLHSLDGTIDDGSGPLYPYINNADCYWLIAPDDSVKNISLQFLKLNTESSNDVVTIYNGPNVSSGVYASYSGSTIPAQITINKKAVLVHFSSDGQNQAEGFLLKYAATTYPYCTSTLTTLTAESGQINDLSGALDYHNSSFCRWKIQPVSQQPIVIEFSQMNLMPGDLVKITKLDGTVLDEFTGTVLPDPIYYSETSLIVVFTATATFHSEGFALTYRTSPTSINPMSADAVLMPNPCEQFITIELQSEYSLHVLNSLGQHVYNIPSLKVGINTIALDDWESGLYFFILENGDSKICKRVVVSKLQK